MAKTKVLAGRKLALVPILRAGMGMLDGMLSLIPAAKVGFIGLYRNEETLQPVEYFCKLPSDIDERDVLVLDPMLATGGSAVDAITLIKKRGAKHIKFIGLIGAPEGVEALRTAHPDVQIYLGAGRSGRVPGPEGLHRPRPGRRRRPHLRHQVSARTCVKLPRYFPLRPFGPPLVAVPRFCRAGQRSLAKVRPLPLLRFGCFVRRTRLSFAVPHAWEAIRNGFEKRPCLTPTKRNKAGPFGCF